MVMKSFSATREVVGSSARDGRAAAHARERRARRPSMASDRCRHASLQGKSARLTALNRKSETRPMRPMTMMPKIIWPVASSAWLSMIMWPMPDEEPMSSATMT